jgi:hypothetical protein
MLMYKAYFMELLRYAPHLCTEKMKVNKFVMNLNVSIHVEVRILMPQMIHDAVQKALIAEEEMIIEVQGKTHVKPMGHATSGVQQHKTPTRISSRYRDMLR